jgi:murein DD-endopeptidase MepM/ murein hydrolase activator NlpD
MTFLVTAFLGIGMLLIATALEGSLWQTQVNNPITPLTEEFRHLVFGDALPANTQKAGSQWPDIGSPNWGAPPGLSPGTKALSSTSSNLTWLNAPVTQAYGGAATGVVNNGLDLGTAFHTPIGSIVSGTVQSATYSPEIGGQVMVAFQQAGQTLYAAYVHLDEIAVSVGQQVNVGTLIGLSGGQLSGGSHNAKYPYSTGPHTLFGIFTKPWAGLDVSINPTSFFNSVKSALSGGTLL